MRLEIKNVSLTLPSGQCVLNQVSAEVNAGDFIVLMGSNGSGKSTLMKVINRQYRCFSGSVRLDGKSIQKIPLPVLSKKVVTLTQFVRDSLFLDMTLLENARLIAGMSGRDALAEYLREFNPNFLAALDRPVSELSGGEQQQLAFALYLTHRPRVLLLDEHTSALDPQAAERVMQMTSDYVREHRVTCLMTTHHPDFARRFGDRHWKMDGGVLRE